MDADLLKQVLDERNDVVWSSQCARQKVHGQRKELLEQRVRRELETVVHHDRDRADATTTVGAHDQHGGDTRWQVLTWSQHVARSRQGEEPFQQLSDQEGRAHRTDATIVISCLPCLRLTNLSTTASTPANLIACGSTMHGRVPSHHSVVCTISRLMP